MGSGHSCLNDEPSGKSIVGKIFETKIPMRLKFYLDLSKGKFPECYLDKIEDLSKNNILYDTLQIQITIDPGFRFKIASVDYYGYIDNSTYEITVNAINHPVLTGNGLEKNMSTSRKSYIEGYNFYEYYSRCSDEVQKLYEQVTQKKLNNFDNIPHPEILFLQTNDINDTHFLKNIKFEKDGKFEISHHDIFGYKEFNDDNTFNWIENGTPIFYNEKYLTLIQ